MKSYEECARVVLARIDEEKKSRRRVRTVWLRVCAAVLFFAILGGGIALLVPEKEKIVHVSGADLMEGITSSGVKVEELSDGFAESYMDFSVKLFQGAYEKSSDNTLVSPLSVRAVLSMMSAGARGQTLREFETLLGSSADTSHRDMYSYSVELLKASFDGLSGEDVSSFGVPTDAGLSHLLADSSSIKIANSLWLPDDGRFQVNRDFLQTNMDYYGAAAYMIPFNKNGADAVNRWVEEHTGGMIDRVIDGLTPEDVLLLVNAVAFEAEWLCPFRKEINTDDIFTTADGREITVEFMKDMGTAGKDYIFDDDSVGIIKTYRSEENYERSGKYSFAAFMPKDESIPFDEYVSSLTGEGIAHLLSNSKDRVYLIMPKFKAEYKTDLVQILSDMGIPSAFDAGAADFTGMGGDVYVSEVVHKTAIEVSETSTKAAAVTGLIARPTGVVSGTPETVTFNRPFVYMIIDNEQNLPVFMGCVTEPMQE